MGSCLKPEDGWAPESVVLVLQGDSPGTHPGIVDGYERLRATGQVQELSVFPVFGPGGVAKGDAFWRDVFEQAAAQNATMIVFQFYHSLKLPDPQPAMRRLRELRSRPLIVSTLGDAFMNGYFSRAWVPRSFRQAARGSDLVTLTSMGPVAERVRRCTDAPILLLPLSACQVRFGGAYPRIQDETPDFDVVFVGSRNANRNPFRPYHWHGRRRSRLLATLSRRFGERFAAFGHGWSHLGVADRGPIPFDNQLQMARRAKVIVGGIPFSTARYYASNRPFIQMLSGVPMVEVQVPGLETLLADGSDLILCTESETVDRVSDVLSWPESERADMGRRAIQTVMERHTDAARVEALVENVRRIRVWRDEGVALPPYLPFFHEQVDVPVEAHAATRSWPQGKPMNSPGRT